MTQVTVSLRPVTAADEPFLLQVYASSRADEMALVPWPEAQKQAFLTAQLNARQQHYEHTYPDARHDIVLVGADPAGSLYVAALPTEIRIVDLTLLPTYHNRGIGSRLLNDLKHEAEKRGIPLTIYVEQFNPSFPIFLHHRFVAGEPQGFYVLLSWTPKIQ
jgi:GNAT superfamily N-acetyltransferase